MNNLICCSKVAEMKKGVRTDEGYCYVDKTCCKALFIRGVQTSSGIPVCNTIVFYKGAWRKPITAFGSGYAGKYSRIPSTIEERGILYW